MDVFKLRNKLIQDYERYVNSFINIRDERIKGKVQEEFNQGLLWPEPLIQLNPSFEKGKWIDELIEERILHPECSRIFRIKGDNEDKSLRTHKHQEDAIRIACAGENYILTTGTGSGKSLSYIIPIVDRVMRKGSRNGIKAIVVYPMNALANSQYGELSKFLKLGFLENKEPVTFGRYTGQESKEEREFLQNNPPDILLTNYMMLELILTRTNDKSIIGAANNLEFLVLDELHTYRGRQGADVAMLIRRLKDTLASDRIQCVGTSATLAGPGTYNQQQQEIAEMASKFFGTEFKPDNIIGETITKITIDCDVNNTDFQAKLKFAVQNDSFDTISFTDFASNPLVAWIENVFGIKYSDESGRLERAKPQTIYGDSGAAMALSQITSLDLNLCADKIKECLLAGYRIKNPDNSFPVFAFKLHQFVSRGDTVYASIDDVNERYITVHGQKYVPGDREKILLPLVFCRECGQEFYAVRCNQDKNTGQSSFEPRNINDRFSDQGSEPGFLYLSAAKPWPDDRAEMVSRVPDAWLEEKKGVIKIRSNRIKHLPYNIYVTPSGKQCLPEENGQKLAYVPDRFRFCPHCGVAYGSWSRSDFGKVGTLGSEGRSTATTIMSLSSVRQLRIEELISPKARKLLSFTDNRQDASLQAGHFNDFVEIGLLRSAIYKAAADAGADGLRDDELTQKIFRVLHSIERFSIANYAQDSSVKYRPKDDTEKTFRDVIGYRIYRDLQRGWRITAPNLEQCGLLNIEYLSLDELCNENRDWEGLHPALSTADTTIRKKVSQTLLDYMRRELAILVEYLDSEFHERLKLRCNQWLKEPWNIDEDEKLEKATVLYPCSRPQQSAPDSVYLSSRGGFGQYLGAAGTFPDYSVKLTLEDKQKIILDILKTLRLAGIIAVVSNIDVEGKVPGYQIKAGAMIWKSGDGTRTFHDPISVPNESELKAEPNEFFVDYYKNTALQTVGIFAKEHTAQVAAELRIERENAFRIAELPILYCSPTMELGVDISELNVVNMRNIPPTPANYAQRSGRAGRSGQPALVFTYSALGSPHDQYFFRRPELMVAGAVVTPRLDLANQDLVRSHIHAVWLEELHQSLGNTLCDILDVKGEIPSLVLKDDIRDAVNNKAVIEKAKIRAERVLKTIATELDLSDWYSDSWLDEVFTVITKEFDQACERWRSLYRAALSQANEQHKITIDASRSEEEKRTAERLRREAKAQLDLLINPKSTYISDFYSYRYFASEGFLPGYSFPRLPLSAYIPGRRGKTDNDEFLSRPRFLAISEFGPRAIVYHEGSQYQINRVILPVIEDGPVIHYIKQCHRCGHIYHEMESDKPDICERCDEELQITYRNLFRMENVSTRRRQRINSDEEERVRMGYEIRTGFSFARKNGYPICREASLTNKDGENIAKIYYAHTATLYRINLGWSRRKNKNQYGYTLDIERGYWAKNEQMQKDDPDDPMSPNQKVVIPYVEDRRNCLLYEPSFPLSAEQVASLQSALKNAIQAEFQLEDSELAAEPLPSMDNFRQILIYESAEGGAGVLRRFLDDPGALSQVARKALEICHFDPETGEDLEKSAAAKEICEAACYDCLMSYSNQRIHSLLDRQLIKDVLLDLSSAKVKQSPVLKSRGDHLKMLLNRCESELEKDWIRFLEKYNLNLPSHPQKYIESCQTRPDFFYEQHTLAVYVDGPPHEYPDRQERDIQQERKMRASGYSVVRFSHKDDWKEVVAKYPNIFGRIE